MTVPLKPAFKPRRLAAAGLAVSMMVLAACSSTPSSPEPDEVDNKGETSRPLTGDIVGKRWNLLLLGTHEHLDLPEPAYFRLSQDGKISGSDGCNRFTGTATLGDKQRIDVDELATTRKACPQLDDAKRVTDMLENAYRYLIDHDRLVFFGPDRRVIGGWRKAD